jgi:hypothetical protein
MAMPPTPIDADWKPMKTHAAAAHTRSAATMVALSGFGKGARLAAGRMEVVSSSTR